MNKKYIGDGVYIFNDGWHIVLETERENGTNQVYLEPELVVGLLEYIATVGFMKTSVLKEALEFRGEVHE